MLYNENMKKRLFFVAFVLICCQFLFAGKSQNNENKIVGMDIGISSGIPFYGSDHISELNDMVNDGDFYRFIIGATANVNFILGKPLKLMFGSDILYDSVWNGADYSNHLDYAFWTGMKFYPGIGGLNGSVAYCLGCRTDFVNNSVQDTVTDSSAWGNGFRLAIEYDFKYGTNHKCFPILGAYYRCMPRGHNDWDNILAAYLELTF